MKARSWLGLLAVITLGYLAASVSAVAKDSKVDVCHLHGEFHTIRVSTAAVAAHERHGDPGEGACSLYCDDLCFNGDFCTVDCDYLTETCITDGPPVDCDDSDPSTIDSCDPAVGCVYGESDCTDGLDNDEDSRTDCADPDCECVGGLTETQQLTAVGLGEDDYFGWAVSMSGDVAIIGAPGDMNWELGSAYIFRRVGQMWMQEAKISGSDPVYFQWFGQSVSISGNVALVGTNGGAAYVFRHDGQDWVEEPKIPGEFEHMFAYSVSLSGDTALIGAPTDDHAGSESGSAYVFRYNGGDWVEEAKLIPSDAAAHKWVGWTVSLFGDVALVGAPKTADLTGSAYVFRFDGQNWNEEAKLTASDAKVGAQFGIGVAVSGDVALVGSHRADGATESKAGAAYVYRYDDDLGWTEQAKLTASDGAEKDYLGEFVSLSGDYALLSTSGATGGKAYLFRYDGLSWVEERKMVASNGGPADTFGWGLCLSGDEAIIGARYHDGVGFDSGAAYYYDLSGL
jgi:hypothetical protein